MQGIDSLVVLVMRTSDNDKIEARVQSKGTVQKSLKRYVISAHFIHTKQAKRRFDTFVLVQGSSGTKVRRIEGLVKPVVIF